MRWAERIAAAALFLAAGSAAAQTGPTRLERAQSLNGPVLQGSVPTFYSPGEEARARQLQTMLAGQKAFYKDALGTDVPLSLAVMNPAHWAVVEPALPFGVPSVSARPHVALMPARWEESKLGFIKPESTAPAAVRARVSAIGWKWDETMKAGADGIIGHEFGHTLLWSYDVKAPRRWLDEILATYAAHAYFQERRPDVGFALDVFTTNGLYGRPRYRSLADYHANYVQILQTDPAGVHWWQAQFLERVKDIYPREGLDFLRRARRAFPVDQPAMSDAEVMARLERLTPGWAAWARALETQTPPEGQQSGQ